MKGDVKEAHLSFGDLCLRSFAYCLVHAVQRPKLHGTKPELDGPSIFVCRHVGFMDPVVLMVKYRKKVIHPLVALDYYPVMRHRLPGDHRAVGHGQRIEEAGIRRREIDDELRVGEDAETRNARVVDAHIPLPVIGAPGT